MNAGIGPLRTGIFNIADIAIVLGAGIVMLDTCRPETKGPVDNHRARSG